MAWYRRTRFASSLRVIFVVGAFSFGPGPSDIRDKPAGSEIVSCHSKSTVPISGSRWLALKLDIAFFRNRRLFNCNHLSLHLRKLRSGLLVATHQEGSGPENYDRRCRR